MVTTWLIVSVVLMLAAVMCFMLSGKKMAAARATAVDEGLDGDDEGLREGSDAAGGAGQMQMNDSALAAVGEE